MLWYGPLPLWFVTSKGALAANVHLKLAQILDGNVSFSKTFAKSNAVAKAEFRFFSVLAERFGAAKNVPKITAVSATGSEGGF